MRKTGLFYLLFLNTQAVLAAFPKPAIKDTTHSFQPALPSEFSTVDILYPKESESFIKDSSSRTHKKELTSLRRRPEEGEPEHHKSNWIASLGGFLLGLCLGPVGYGISRLTKNKILRKGAIAGFKVFLILCGIYLALLLALVLLFISLGLIKI